MSLDNVSPGLPAYDCYRQHYGSVLYQQTGRDTFSLNTLSNGVSIPVATVKGDSCQVLLGLSKCDHRPPVQAGLVSRVSVPREGLGSSVCGVSHTGQVRHSPQH